MSYHSHHGNSLEGQRRRKVWRRDESVAVIGLGFASLPQLLLNSILCYIRVASLQGHQDSSLREMSGWTAR